MESPIKIIRKRLGITQGGLSVITKIPQSRISIFETGFEKPSENAYQGISDATGFDIFKLKAENEDFIEFKAKEILDKVQLIKNQS